MSFKRFDFFSSGVVHSLGSVSSSPSPPDATCCAAGHGLFALGLSDNHIAVLATDSPSPKPVLLDAQVPIRAICTIEGGLVTVHDQLVINMWRGSPVMTKQRRVIEGGSERHWPAVTCVCATPDGRSIAVGLADGHVVVLMGQDVCRMLPPARPSNRIQGLGYSRDGMVLWIASDAGVWTHVDGAGFDVLDTEGCAPLCASAAPEDCFALAQPDRIALFTTESQGSCYAVPGEKVMLAKAKSHLVVVFQGPVWRPKLPQPAGTSTATVTMLMPAALPAFASSGSQQQLQTADSRHTLQVLDLHNKIIAHEFALGRDMAEGHALFVCGDDSTGAVFLVTSARKVWRFAEKSVDARLDELVKRNLFSTAISIAKSDGCTPALICDLYKRYGDHLCDKGNFDDAVTQYIRTINKLEASYVIRKLLDAPRLRNLTAYLQAVLLPLLPAEPDAPAPSADLTTLLLNCYTRLRDDQGIATLLSRKDARMDVDAALAVLRDTRRVDQALALAKERKRHAWYVRTVLDTQPAPEAQIHILQYLSALPREDAIPLLQSHAPALLQHQPEQTVKLIVEHVRRPEPFPADAFLDVLVDFPDALATILLECVQVRDNLSPAVWSTLLELCVRAKRNDDAMAVLRDPRAKYDALAALGMMKGFGFGAGEVYLLERSEMWDALLQRRMSEQQNEAVLEIAQQRGDVDVWMRVLAYVANKLDVGMVKRVLRQVGDVIPPLLVLRILAAQPMLPLEAARTYLALQIERASSMAEHDEVEVAQLRSDTLELRRQAKALREEPRVFSATVCAMTGAPLELPVVHFLSMNSYNLSSLPSGALERLEDPKCAAEQRAVFDIAKGLQQRRADVDAEFFDEIEGLEGDRAFNLAADFFGKCLFGVDEDGDEV